jgi:hypothetical protein
MVYIKLNLRIKRPCVKSLYMVILLRSSSTELTSNPTKIGVLISRTKIFNSRTEATRTGKSTWQIIPPDVSCSASIFCKPTQTLSPALATLELEPFFSMVRTVPIVPEGITMTCERKRGSERSEITSTRTGLFCNLDSAHHMPCRRAAQFLDFSISSFLGSPNHLYLSPVPCS